MFRHPLWPRTRPPPLGAGVALDPSTSTAGALREAVATVIDDQQIGQLVREMRERTRSAGGYGRAADALAGTALMGAERRKTGPGAD
jgi:UDP:flavonoid glycosyltransferase YjiC (YdhE family)